MKVFLTFLLTIELYIAHGQVSFPYEANFENGIPTSWSTDGLWKINNHTGINNSSSLAARDHTIIPINSSVFTNVFDLSATDHPSVSFSITMGRFADGNSNFLLLADYGKGWKPLVGCSEDTNFSFSEYKGLRLIKFPENIYDMNDSTTWFPNQKAPYQNITVNLDSLKQYNHVQFKMLSHFYYGGVVFIDNFKLENRVLNYLLEKEGLTSDNISIFPNPSHGYLQVKSTEILESLNLYNSTGIKIYTKLLPENESIIETSHYPEGIYILEGKESVSHKVLRKQVQIF